MSAQTPIKKPIVKPPEKSEALTVLVILVVALSIVSYFVFFTRTSGFVLKAKFKEADGLKIGAEVQCAGVKAGNVRNIRFLGVPVTKGDENLFELTLELSPQINGQPIGKIIRKDAKAIIIIVGALGDRGVNIIPGTINAPGVVNGDYILGETELTPAMISANLGIIRKKFESIQQIIEDNAKWINDGKGTLGKYNKPNNEAQINLRHLLELTDSLEPLIRKGKGTVGKFQQDKEFADRIERFSKLVDELEDQIQTGNGSTGKFLKDKELDNRVILIENRAKTLLDRFQKLAEKAQKGNGSAAKFLNNQEFRNDINKLETNFNHLLTKVTNKKGSLNLFINDTRLSENISTISIEMAKLAYDIRQKPRKYVKFTLF